MKEEKPIAVKACHESVSPKRVTPILLSQHSDKLKFFFVRTSVVDVWVAIC